MNISLEPVPDPETGFPQVPMGYYWEIIRVENAGSEVNQYYPNNFLRVQLMGPEGVNGYNDMVYIASGFSSFYSRVNPTKETAIKYANSVYEKWAEKVIREHDENQLIGVYNKR